MDPDDIQSLIREKGFLYHPLTPEHIEALMLVGLLPDPRIAAAKKQALNEASIALKQQATKIGEMLDDSRYAGIETHLRNAESHIRKAILDLHKAAGSIETPR